MVAIRNWLKIFGAFVTISLFAQPHKNSILLTVNNQPITTEEFTNLYLKNTGATGTKISKETLDEYLNLFINFKLKVQAACDAGIDTLPSFISEYNGYIDQLAQSYLIDKEAFNRLTGEAYQRMQEEVSASHILINIPDNTLPSDTIKYYQKALEARKRITKGEPFGKVALEMSNDPSVNRNNGYLGWFSAFQMVYPFESTAYSTPIDSVSMPVRTRFGYHIIKVHDRRPTKGQIKIAHIMIKTQPNASPQQIEDARQKIVAIHNRLVKGEDFAAVAKAESQDNSSAPNGGELPWIRSGQIIPEFEQVAFSLDKIGEISQPFQTAFGWHVVKLIDRKLPGNFEEMLPDIKNLISRDSRSMLMRESFINKLKISYRYKENPIDFDKTVINLLDSSLYKNKWTTPELKTNPSLITLNGIDFKLSDFLEYIAKNQQLIRQQPIPIFAHNIFKEWITQTILETEKSLLPEKYLEFKQLAKEYLEGMLLFEISNQMIWNKVQDSVALAQYFEQNRNNYVWNQRVHYTLYQTSDASVAKKVHKKLLSKNYLTPFDLAIQINKKGDILSYSQNITSPNDSIVANYDKWDRNVKFEHPTDGTYKIIQINKVAANQPKNLEECRAEVVTDYQNLIEKMWIDELKSKYPVSVNSEVYEQLVKNLSQ